MTAYLRVLVVAAGLSLAQGALASEEVEHYKGEPAETLEQAVANFSEYNARLAAVLEQGELSAQDLGAIHQMTYTLENALERIRHDLSALAETLEELHQSSERADYAGTKAHGEAYLESARKVIP